MKKVCILLIALLLFISCNDNFYEGLLLHQPRLPDGFKICLIGDSGMGGEAQYRVADALAKEGCDQVRHLGDVIYQNGLSSRHDPQFVTKFYDPYWRILEEQKVPFYIALGNHDHGGNVNAWFDLASEYEAIKFPGHIYAEAWGDICFITLDTDRPYLKQFRWLEKVRKKLKNRCQLSFALGHHPYISVGSHGDATGIHKLFLSQGVIGKFDAYLSGHNHSLSDEGLSHGTRLLVSGAAGKLNALSRMPDPGNFAVVAFGYITMTIQRDKTGPSASYEVVTVGKEETQVVHRGNIQGRGIR